jgi:Nucleotidyl transferase AbiEii toxin, Type IV TA system
VTAAGALPAPLPREALKAMAAETGFLAAALERTASLLGLMTALVGDDGSLWLDGGAALHLAGEGLPARLTADLDLMHRGSALRGEAVAAVEARLAEAGLAALGRLSDEAAVRWLVPAGSALGPPGVVRVDLVLRAPVPLWDGGTARPRLPGGGAGPEVPVPAPEEAAGNKVAALFLRRRARDLFDAHHLLTRRALDRARMRAAFVAGVAARPVDPRGFSPRDVAVEAEDVRRGLAPLLPAAARGEAERDPAGWGARLAAECRDALSAVLPLTRAEREFVRLLRERGELRPGLLTADAALAERIALRPELAEHAARVRAACGARRGHLSGG